MRDSNIRESKAREEGMSVVGMALCIQDDSVAQAMRHQDCEIESGLIAPVLRRRTSIATKMAITALDRACEEAGVDKDMPVIFSSSIGEMAVTDKLCNAIADARWPLSPTLFHNSVHNTAAGYWSLSIESMAPMQSMAGLEDSFAMGLLEAYGQLRCGAKNVLLVCYDESMPEDFLPDYAWQAYASAWVLSVPVGGKPWISCPYSDAGLNQPLNGFGAFNPALQGIRLYEYLQTLPSGTKEFPVSNGEAKWLITIAQNDD